MRCEKAVKEAGELVKHVDGSIEENVKKGIYGNQQNLGRSLKN